MPWVQPIAAFATHGTAPASALEQLILKAIIELAKNGAIVKNVVCDSAQPNKGGYKLFGIEVTLEKTKNFIQHPTEPNEKMFFLHDVPHIMKCVRNQIFNKKKVQVKTYMLI